MDTPENQEQAAEPVEDTATEAEATSESIAEDEDVQQEDTASSFATVNTSNEDEEVEVDEVGEGLLEALLDDDADDDLTGVVLAEMDAVLDSAASIIEDTEPASIDDELLASPVTDATTAVHHRAKDEARRKVIEFLERTGIDVGSVHGTAMREAVLVEAKGTTAGGDEVYVKYNKSGTTIRLYIGKRIVKEGHALLVLRRLVQADKIELESLTLTFVDGDADDDEDLDELTFSAGDPASCKALLLSAQPLPIGWIDRDVNTLCAEIASGLDTAEELVDSYLTLVSGGVRCILSSNNKVIGLQRWLFEQGTIHSLRWEDGGERAAQETLRILTATEMLQEMYEFRQAGWTGFELLPNPNAAIMIRQRAHVTSKGNYRETTKALRHEIDNHVIYVSSVLPHDKDDDDAPFGVATSVSGLWGLIRRHITTAFEEQLQVPIERLVEMKDSIDRTVAESLDEMQGLVDNAFLTRTAEQFEQVVPEEEEEPEPEEEELLDDDDEDEELDEGRMTLGTEGALEGLRRAKQRMQEGAGDDDDEPPPTRDPRVGRKSQRRRGTGRGRGKPLAGETRRSRA